MCTTGLYLEIPARLALSLDLHSCSGVLKRINKSILSLLLSIRRKQFGPVRCYKGGSRRVN
jgi:hypothetical protein